MTCWCVNLRWSARSEGMRNRANADHEWTSERSDHPVFPNERTIECRRHGAKDQANHNPRPRIGLLRFLHLVHRLSTFVATVRKDYFWSSAVSGETPS